MFGSEKRENLAIERLQDACNALTVSVGELQSANKRLELEWTETYDKIRHQLSRMARRGDLSNGKDLTEIVEPETTDEPVLDTISAKIHARRNRGFLGRTE